MALKPLIANMSQSSSGGGGGSGDVTQAANASEANHVFVSGGANKTRVETPVEIDPSTGDMSGIGDMEGDSLDVDSIVIGGRTVTTLNLVTKNTATNYTIGTTNANELYGGVIYVTGAATITIPAVASGASFTIITVGAVAVSVDPNAADLIVLNGTALSDGDKITNASTTGDMAVFTYYDATGWYASTNTGWTDTN